MFNKCVHPTLPIEEQCRKKWLRSKSLVHRTLKNIVYNKTLMRDIKMLTSFHHTGALEVFHSLLSKYCPKRQHFSYIGMQSYIKVAILDHNYNTKRSQATTKQCMLTFKCETKFSMLRYKMYKDCETGHVSFEVCILLHIKNNTTNKTYHLATYVINNLSRHNIHGHFFIYYRR